MQQDSFKESLIVGLGQGLGIALVVFVLSKFKKIGIHHKNPKWIKK